MTKSSHNTNPNNTTCSKQRNQSIRKDKTDKPTANTHTKREKKRGGGRGKKKKDRELLAPPTTQGKLNQSMHTISGIKSLLYNIFIIIILGNKKRVKKLSSVSADFKTIK